MCHLPDGYYREPGDPYASGMQIKRWADDVARNDRDGFQTLGVNLALSGVRMAHTLAHGEGLVSNGQLGVDLIRVPAGKGFVPHIHPGDHILIVVGGRGTITCDGIIYPTVAGEVYMVPGNRPHAVGAITDHAILAVGAPHKAVDDPARMAPVEYMHVIAHTGAMRCLICRVAATWPAMLHEQGCPHCPCPLCVSTGNADEDARLVADYNAAVERHTAR